MLTGFEFDLSPVYLHLYYEHEIQFDLSVYP